MDEKQPVPKHHYTWKKEKLVHESNSGVRVKEISTNIIKRLRFKREGNGTPKRQLGARGDRRGNTPSLLSTPRPRFLLQDEGHEGLMEGGCDEALGGRRGGGRGRECVRGEIL